MKGLSENYQPLSKDSEGQLIGGFALAGIANPNDVKNTNNCNCIVVPTSIDPNNPEV